MGMVLKISMTLIEEISLSLAEYLASPEYQELSRQMEESRVKYEKDCDEYWDSLEYEDKLKAFYSVIKRLHQGEVKDKGTYRWILYDVFEFGPESYAIGMECGLMALHNAYVDIDEFEALRKENRELKNK
jgi:hypothetical protein